MPLDHARSKTCAVVILYRRCAGGSAGVPPAYDEKLCRSSSSRPVRRRTLVAEAGVEPARAGTPIGSLYHGPGSGNEARPALPLVFPDPAVYSWQLGGLQGDVIVEVTIDEQGNVTETRVLQSLQQNIDDKVIATLKSWRFRPATVDGVAISSRQDVHFHFPS